MTNEPRAAVNLDPEMIAAYIDQRLSPEQRAAVEAQLAADPDSYALFVETVKALDALSPAAAAPAAARPSRWWLAGGALAAAAVVVLAILPAGTRDRWLGRDPGEVRMARLVAAVGEQRYVEPRLTGGFAFGPLRPVTRSAPSDLSRENLELFAAAAALREAAEQDPSVAHLTAWGVAQVLTREYDAAVATLQQVAAQDASGRASANLSAALLARGAALGRDDDVPAALDAADAALRRQPGLVEALFNRALALERLNRPADAAAAWEAVLVAESSGPWADEARAHRSRLAR